MANLVPTERIDSLIFLLRGHKVMLDADLAELYGVETKALNRAFMRNREWFPEDFVKSYREILALLDRIEKLRRETPLWSKQTRRRPLSRSLARRSSQNLPCLSCDLKNKTNVVLRDGADPTTVRAPDQGTVTQMLSHLTKTPIFGWPSIVLLLIVHALLGYPIRYYR